jgi:alpha-galactosidase
MRITDRKTGEDLRPALMERLQTMEEPAFKYRNDIRLHKKMAEIFDVFTYPSDDHFGEYLAWGSTFMGTRWHRGREWKPVPPGEAGGDGTPTLEDFASGKARLDEHVLRSSGEITVPAICDIMRDRGSRRDAVNVRNTGRYIENLPADAAVEVPARIDAKGLHPERVGPLKEPFAAFLRTQVSINKLIAEAYVTRRKKLLLQALLLDPFVNSVTAAEEMLGVMLDLQKEYIPEFR